jgi:hypothetical protein
MNVFAFLLVCLSIIIFLIPQDIFLFILKIICVLLPVISAIGIFSQWKVKNRKLKILIARNKTMIRIDTFNQLKETLCGLVVADIALRELRKTEYYKSFSKTNWKKIRSAVLGLNSRMRVLNMSMER